MGQEGLELRIENLELRIWNLEWQAGDVDNMGLGIAAPTRWVGSNATMRASSGTWFGKVYAVLAALALVACWLRVGLLARSI